MHRTSIQAQRSVAASKTLTLKLVAAVRAAEGGSSASRLWAEAYRAVIDPLKSLFEVEIEFPAKIRAAKHWAILIVRLEREAEVAANSQWLNFGSLPDVETRIHRFASRNDWNVADCVDLWMAQGCALRDAVEQLGIDLCNPDVSQPDVIGVCSLCWKTGEPFKRGDGFFCVEHGNVGSDSYQKARDRTLWRDPSQRLKPRISFVWHHVREIRAQLPRPLIVEPVDLIPMAKVCRGLEVDASSFRHVLFDLSVYSPLLKRVNRHFEIEKVRPNAKSQMKFLAAFDPMLPSLFALQRRMHEVMIQDNRILLDRLIYAEACLEADTRRRSNRGPESAPSPKELGRAVVPYVFSYSGMDSVVVSFS